MLSSNSKYPGPFKPKPVPLPDRIPSYTPSTPSIPPAQTSVRVAPMMRREKLSPWMRPTPTPVVIPPAPPTDSVFDQHPGPMKPKPPDVPLPPREKSGANDLFSPGAGFGQNDVLDAIFQRLGY